MKSALRVMLLASCGIGMPLAAQAQSAPTDSAAPPPAPAASAQQADTGGEMADIVVTARKREERLQSVPISIAAFSGEALERRNIQAITDVSKFVPNLTLDTGARSGGGSFGSQIFIRGIGQLDYSVYADPGVGLYVDGVYVGRTQGSVLDVLDVERIEVLRGPQGTLFGRNTIGGAISVVSAKPTSEFGGYIQGSVGRFDQKDLRASLNVPLTDRLAVKFSFATKNRDGYAHSLITNDEFGDQHSVAGRVVARWTPSDSIESTTIFDITHQRQGGQFQRVVSVVPTASLPAGTRLFNSLVASRTPYAAFDSRWLPTSTYTNFASGPNINNLDSWGLSEDLEFKLSDDVTLSSITSYRDLRFHVAVDIDGSPLNLASLNDVARQHQFSQELRLGGTAIGDRLKWLVGGYYFREKIDYHNTAILFGGLYSALEALPGPIFPPSVPFGGRSNPANVSLDLALGQVNQPINTTYAAFTQATFKLADRLSITGGLRYNDDQKDITVVNTRAVSRVVSFPLTTRSAKFKSWTPKASIEFQATPDLLFYASYAKGFKVGGFNARASDPFEFNTYNPEQVSTYEAGFKSEWFDHRLRVNAAAFHSDYTDLQFVTQVPIGTPLPPGSVPANCPKSPFCTIAGNAAQARIQGFEAEATARLFPNFDLSASVGYNHNKYTKLDPTLPQQGILITNKLPKTPEWTINLGAQHVLPISNFANLTTRVDYSYRSTTYNDFENTPVLTQPGYGLLGARIALAAPDNGWELALSGQNLTDKVYISSGFGAAGTFGFNLAGFAAPRTWTLTGTVRFGKH